MKHTHPFPARMAPEIALNELEKIGRDSLVLDPMSGSGMVLAQASQLGIRSIGIDMDPLARLISSVGATPVDEKSVRKYLSRLLDLCRSDIDAGREVHLSWIDDDPATAEFISYWFDYKQKRQLRVLSHHLVVEPITTVKATLNVLMVAVSRLIVTKEPKASLARDTAHSRPHRTITENDFDVLEALPASVEHILSALSSHEPKTATKTYLGDARKLGRIPDASVDCVITSPPYLNAIDYMRGHRLSLVWWGYSVSKLSKIRGATIGSERKSVNFSQEQFLHVLEEFQVEGLSLKFQAILKRYFDDLTLQLAETARVLKVGGAATYVVGNSNIRGTYVPNHELLKLAAKNAGLTLRWTSEREIPNNRRYLPTPKNNENALAGRMRTEFILKFSHANHLRTIAS